MTDFSKKAELSKKMSALRVLSIHGVDKATELYPEYKKWLIKVNKTYTTWVERQTLVMKMRNTPK